MQGIRALQKGLVPGIAYQCALNGTRLGLYNYLKQTMVAEGAQEGTSSFFFLNVASSALSGAVGAAVGSPFYMVKVRLQTQNAGAATSSGKQIGYQHKYNGMGDAFRHVVKTEGVAGLMRGVQGIDSSSLKIENIGLIDWAQCYCRLVTRIRFSRKGDGGLHSTIDYV